MNPFKILNIKQGADKKEIIRAVASGMQNKKYSAYELAQAQKMLLAPVSAAVQTFLHCIDLDPLKAALDVKCPDNLGTEQLSELNRLDIFDDRI